MMISPVFTKQAFMSIMLMLLSVNVVIGQSMSLSFLNLSHAFFCRLASSFIFSEALYLEEKCF